MGKTAPNWLEQNQKELAASFVEEFRATFSDPAELAAALRAALISKSLIQKSIRFRHTGEEIEFGAIAPDGKVPFTICEYPSPQGRLDSLIAGILKQPRPRSWYHPDSGEFCERTR